MNITVKRITVHANPGYTLTIAAIAAAFQALAIFAFAILLDEPQSWPVVLAAAVLGGVLIVDGEFVHRLGHAIADLAAGADHVTVDYGRRDVVGHSDHALTAWTYLAGPIAGVVYGIVMAVVAVAVWDLFPLRVALLVVAAVRIGDELLGALAPDHDVHRAIRAHRAEA